MMTTILPQVRGQMPKWPLEIIQHLQFIRERGNKRGIYGAGKREQEERYLGSQQELSHFWKKDHPIWKVEGTISPSINSLHMKHEAFSGAVIPSRGGCTKSLINFKPAFFRKEEF